MAETLTVSGHRRVRLGGRGEIVAEGWHRSYDKTSSLPAGHDGTAGCVASCQTRVRIIFVKPQSHFDVS
jgi:hypothetical protein